MGCRDRHSVVALTDCDLRCISHASYRACAQRHPEIFGFFATLLAKRLREAEDAIAAMTFLTVKGRVAHALLEIADHLGEKTDSGGIVIPNSIRQKDVAALAGVARENVNRILKSWERRKLLMKFSRSYRIDDKAKLEREIE